MVLSGKSLGLHINAFLSRGPWLGLLACFPQAVAGAPLLTSRKLLSEAEERWARPDWCLCGGLRVRTCHLGLILCKMGGSGGRVPELLFTFQSLDSKAESLKLEGKSRQ